MKSKQTLPAPEPQDVRSLPLERRQAMAVAFAQSHGIDWRGIPIDAGSHIIIPKIQVIDLWAGQAGESGEMPPQEPTE